LQNTEQPQAGGYKKGKAGGKKGEYNIKKKELMKYELFLRVREEIRTLTISRHPLKVVRLPISPPGLIKSLQS
jgi:hypothetical protein